MEAGTVEKLVWLHAEPHDLKISTAVILSEERSSAAVSDCVQTQECGVTIINSSNLAAAFAVLLAWLGVGRGGQGKVDTSIQSASVEKASLWLDISNSLTGLEQGKNHILPIPPTL